MDAGGAPVRTGGPEAGAAGVPTQGTAEVRVSALVTARTHHGTGEPSLQGPLKVAPFQLWWGFFCP